MKHFTCILLFLLLGVSAPAQEKGKGNEPKAKAESPGFVAAKKAYAAGKYKEAIRLLEAELATEKKKAKPDENRVGKIHSWLGASYFGADLRNKALEHFQKCLTFELKRLGPNHPYVANSYNNIGMVHDEGNEHDKALEYYQKSLNIWLKQLGADHPQVAISYNNIGTVHLAKGEYDKALKYLQKALTIQLKRLGPNHPDVGRSYNNIGAVYSNKGEYDKTLEWYHKSLVILLKQLGEDHPYLAHSYNNIGKAHLDKGEYDNALEFYQKSLNIWLKRRQPDHPRVANSYNNIGKVHLAKGEYDKALDILQKCLAIQVKQLGPDHPDVGNSYNEIGGVHNEKAEYDKALEYHQKSLAILLKQFSPDHPDVGASYNNIGNVHYSKGDYDKALEYHQKSLVIKLKQLGLDHPDVAVSYSNIGLVHRAKGDYYKSLKSNRKALAILLKKLGPDHPQVATSYGSIGVVFRAWGVFDKAMYDKALEYFQKALAIKLKQLGPNHPNVANSYINIGAVHNFKGEYDKASEYHQKSLAIRLKQLGPNHPDVATSYHNIGFAQHSLKNPVAALAAARKAQAIRDKRLAYMLSFTSERERLAYQRTLSPYNLPGTLGSAPDLAKATLHNKGIVLSSILEDQLTAQASSDPKMKELVSQLRTAFRQLNKLEMEDPKDTSEKGWKVHRTKREAARTKAEALQKQLARTVTGFGEARASLSLTIKDVQDKLAEDAVLLEYIAYYHFQGKGQFEERYGAIVLSKGGEPKWVPLGPVEPINKLLAQASPMKRAPDEAYEKVLRGLYDKLMAPVVKQLPKGTKTLILSPDGSLNFLSFATLLTGKDRFLCEDYTLKYVSSGRDLVPGKQINLPKGSLVVFANPTYDEVPVQLASANGVTLTLRSLDRDEMRGGLKFKALPGTQKEADYLGGKVGDWKLQSKVYTGKTATEAAISSVQSPRILHLATHGFFLPEEKAKDDPRGKPLMLGNEQQKYRGPIRNPMHRSGLALAGAQKTLDAWAKGETPPAENDGILTAAEVSVLNLKGTWLVALSACDTGQGEARSGEGVLGLRRAFIQAGTQNLLMTLWPVSDKYTVPFMKDFYEKAFASGDAPTVLTEVQKEMLLEFRKKYGTRLAVQLYGPFIMSFRGVK